MDYASFNVVDLELDVLGYVDVDWVGCAFDHQSTGDFLAMLHSKKRPTMALSNHQRKVQAVIVATYEIALLCKLLENLEYHTYKKVVVYCANLSSLHRTCNLPFHARMSPISLYL